MSPTQGGERVIAAYDNIEPGSREGIRFLAGRSDAEFLELVQVGLPRRICVEAAKEALGRASAVSSTPSLRANAQTFSETQDMLLSTPEQL